MGARREITDLQMKGRVGASAARDLYRLVEASEETWGILGINLDATICWGYTTPGYKPRPIWLRVKLSEGVEVVLGRTAVLRGGNGSNSWEVPLDPNGPVTGAMRALLRQAAED